MDEKFTEAVWWLIRAGLAIDIARGSGYIVSLQLTRRGEALLDSDEDNPLLPGFLDRIKQRCPRLLTESSLCSSTRERVSISTLPSGSRIAAEW
jgi:hypothetical protein